MRIKDKYIKAILTALVILFVFLWISKPQKVVNTNQTTIDSLKDEIEYYNCVIHCSDSVIEVLDAKIDSLVRLRNDEKTYLNKIKKDYENQIKYISGSLDSNIVYFRTKFTQDSSH